MVTVTLPLSSGEVVAGIMELQIKGGGASDQEGDGGHEPHLPTATNTAVWTPTCFFRTM